MRSNFGEGYLGKAVQSRASYTLQGSKDDSIGDELVSKRTKTAVQDCDKLTVEA